MNIYHVSFDMNVVQYGDIIDLVAIAPTEKCIKTAYPNDSNLIITQIGITVDLIYETLSEYPFIITENTLD